MRLVSGALALAWVLAGTAQAESLPQEPQPKDPAPEAEEEAPFAFFVAPIASYDTNLLFGFGGFGQAVVADPVGNRPYKSSVALQAFGTLGGFQDHFVRWDLPGMLQSRFRWDGELRYLSWSRVPYYGLGNHTPRLNEDMISDPYYLWSSVRWSAGTNLRYDLRWDDWEVYLTGRVYHQDVATDPRSLLAEQAPAGIDGGLLSLGGLGLLRDTRTNEIDPSDGSVWDFQVRASDPVIGSASRFVGVHTSWRGYLGLHERVVLAARVLGDATSPDTPFYETPYLGGIDGGTVGGRYFLRGLEEERLRAHGVLGGQTELRWTFAQSHWFKFLDLGWGLAPFVDAARVWTWGEPLPLRLAPHLTGGAGLRINIEGLLVVRCDVGVAAERYELDPTRRGQTQVYILGDHPF